MLVTASCFALLVVLPTPGGAVQWTAKEIVRAGLGSEAWEFGYDGIAETESASVELVGCYTVTDTEILIHDQIKDDVKVFNMDGSYDRTVPIRRVYPTGEVGLPVIDIAVRGSEILVLCEFSGLPTNGDQPWSRFQLFRFDSRTGDLLGRYFLQSDDIGLSEQGLRLSRSVVLQRSVNSVSLYDLRSRQSYPVRIEERTRSTVQQLSASAERPVGRAVVIQDRETSTIQLVGENGQTMNALPGDGALITVADDGQVYEVAKPDFEHDIWNVSIYDISGEKIGTFVRPPRDWGPFAMLSVYQLDKLMHVGSQAIVFELCVNRGGVVVTEWKE